MQDVLEIGSVPHEEECAQLGSHDYARRGPLECRVYIAQLIRMFGEPPAGARLYVKANPHDFGTYYEAAVMYDSGDEEATAYAFNVESNSPDKWDAIARAELAKGYATLKESESVMADESANTPDVNTAEEYAASMVAANAVGTRTYTRDGDSVSIVRYGMLYVHHDYAVKRAKDGTPVHTGVGALLVFSPFDSRLESAITAKVMQLLSRWVEVHVWAPDERMVAEFQESTANFGRASEVLPMTLVGSHGPLIGGLSIAADRGPDGRYAWTIGSHT